MFSVYKKIVSPESSPILTPITPFIDSDVSLDLGPSITGARADFINTACKCCASHRDAIVRTVSDDVAAAAAAASSAKNHANDSMLDQYINLNYSHSTHSTHYQYRKYTPRGIHAFDVQMYSK